MPLEGQELGLAIVPSCVTCSDRACGCVDLNGLCNQSTGNKVLLINFIHLYKDIAFWLGHKLPILMDPIANHCFHLC